MLINGGGDVGRCRWRDQLGGGGDWRDVGAEAVIEATHVAAISVLRAAMVAAMSGVASLA